MSFRVLVVAPHPMYQERGTPIDVMLVLRVLAERPGTDVHLLTYHEGEPVDVSGVTVHRIPAPPGVSRVRPGLSWKKLACDLYLAREFARLLRRERFDFVHAGEEAAVLGWLAQRYTGIPYGYDLDSSIAQQVVERYPFLSVASSPLRSVESALIREALATFPVCRALADLCVAEGAKAVFPLFDISQLADPDAPRTGVLRHPLGLSEEDLLVLYTGNLEPYQGVDLLLEGFARAAPRNRSLHLAVIGGVPADVARLSTRIRSLGLEDRAHALGPRPFDRLDRYLADADILASPRIRGINTPMKVFPYLHSGRPLLATDLPTHSQVLTRREALLVPATSGGVSSGLLRLAGDPELRGRLGRGGRALVERAHTFDAHRDRLNAAYDHVEREVRAQGAGRRTLRRDGRRSAGAVRVGEGPPTAVGFSRSRSE